MKEGLQKLFAYIPASLHRRAKSTAALMGIDLKDFVAMALENYLSEKNKKSNQKTIITEK